MMARRTILLQTAIVAAMLVVACVVVLLALSQKKAEAAFPGANGRIVYSASECCTDTHESIPDQVFTIKPDGSGLKQLTHSADAYNIAPVFSPDGKKIAWTKNEPGAGNVWVMNADGTNKQRLTSGPTEDADPAFSPNGRWVAFVRYNDIFMKSLYGGGLRRLTNTPDYLEHSPAFRPGGGRIAFSRAGFTPGCGCANLPELATMHRDGTDVREITDIGSGHVESPGAPDWSPDGSTLVYSVYNYNTEVGHIETIKPDGTGRQTIFDPPFPHGWSSPVFSPDGTKIAFASGKLFTINADGSGLSNITNTTNDFEYLPDWQPKLQTTD
jgi:Tol biopolymer transport system component